MNTQIQVQSQSEAPPDGLPDLIAALETEQKDINDQLADGSLYAKDGALATQYAQRVAAIDDELLACLERQEALAS